MNPNPVRCYATNVVLAEARTQIEGYVHYPEYNEPPCLFTVSIIKMSWDEFQQHLETWKSPEEVACTVVNKDEVYVTVVTFMYDTDKVHELEQGPADEIEEYALMICEKPFLGLPTIVYCHLIGHLKTRLSLSPADKYRTNSDSFIYFLNKMNRTPWNHGAQLFA